jgi:Sulfotransferase domain
MPPIFICAGIYRSGSTWAFNVCRELGQVLAEQTGRSLASGYPNLGPLDQFLEHAAEQTEGPIVVKAHLLGPVALSWINSGKAREIYTCRDPRDCVASDMKFKGHDIDAAGARVLECLRNFSTFRDSRRILLVRYEQMMADRFTAISQIASHLGFNLDERAIGRIDERTNLSTSLRTCQELKTRPGGQYRRDGAHRVDPTTLLYDNHIAGGTIGRWKQDLSPDQQGFLTRFFAPWLVTLGYGSAASVSSAWDDAPAAVASSH